MDRSKYCGCKGIRTCLMCEEQYGLADKQKYLFEEVQCKRCYTYCLQCDKSFVGWDETDHINHQSNSENSSTWIHIPGIYVVPNFVTPEEEKMIVDAIDTKPWDNSQSGRRKQNFGPACNFRKHKIKTNIISFPTNFLFIQNRFNNYDILKSFFTIEQCFLEYNPNRGACIDPHIDDCWIWGERIVTVNLLSDSVLSLTKYSGSLTDEKYNLNYCSYNKPADKNKDLENAVIRIPLPRRSLIVLFDEARYIWEHFILRSDIKSRRVAIAYREFTQNYLPGGSNHNEIIEFYSYLKTLYA